MTKSTDTAYSVSDLMDQIKDSPVKNPGEMAGIFLQYSTKMDGKKFEWYPYEWDVLKDMSRFIIINKARQIGISRTMAGLALAYSLMFKYFTTLFVSSGEDSAKRILAYSYDFLNSMDQRPTNLTTENKGEISFSTHSKLVSLPNNPKTVRGYKADLIIVDEFAHFVNAQAMMSAISPSISRGGRLLIASNPCGKLNLFSDIWHNDKSFKQYRIPWTECPDEKYRAGVELLKMTMDPIQFSQEYECRFLVEDLQVFSQGEVMGCVDDSLTEHSEPMEGEHYHFGIDFGRSVSSTVVIIVGVRGETVFMRRAIEMPKTNYTVQFNRIYELEKRFRPDIINVDSTGIGTAPFEILQKKLGNKIQGYDFRSYQFKAKVVGDLRVLFQDRRLMLPRHKKLLQQLFSLEKQFMPRSDGFRYKHATGTQDDFVWALGLAIVGLRDRQRKPIEYKFVGEDRPMAKEVMPAAESRARMRTGGVKRVFY